MTVEEKYDEDTLIGPTNDEFEDWWAAAEAYAWNNFPDWHPAMVKKFASDVAWQCEGWILTPSKMEKASEDWFSGANPYSPHCVPQDGYDYREWHERDRDNSGSELIGFAVGKGMDSRMASQFTADTLSSYSFISKEDFERAWNEWWTGTNDQSPHFVPLDDVNKRERDERRAYLREKYSHISDSSFRLFFHRRLTDSAIIEEHFMSKKK